MNFLDEILIEAEKAEEARKLELDNLRADQFLMAIDALEIQLADVNKLADEEVQIIEQYRRSETERLEKKVKWLSWNLEQFMRSTDSKTLKLPHGVLKMRTGRDKVEVKDIEGFLKNSENQKFLRVVPESYQPDIQTIHDHLKRTGEIPDGVVLIPAEVRFSYTTFKRSGDNGKANEQQPAEA